MNPSITFSCVPAILSFNYMEAAVDWFERIDADKTEYGSRRRNMDEYTKLGRSEPRL